MRNLLIALVLVVTALTFYSALWFKSVDIENDITKRVTDDLNATDAQNVAVDVDGRHVTLSGVVYDEATETAHLKTADDTWGALGPIDGLTYVADGGFVTAVKDAAGITLRGTVPNEDVRATLLANAQAATDGAITDELTVSGPTADWQNETAFGVTQLAELDTGTLTTSSNAYSLSGSTDGDPSAVTGTLADRDGWQSFVTSPMAVRDLSDELDGLQNGIVERDQTIASLESTVDDQGAQITALTSERDAVGTELASLRSNLTAGETNSEGLRAQLEEATGMLVEKDQIIADNTGTIDDLTGQVSGLEAELANGQTTLATTQDQVASLRGDLNTANATIDDLTVQVEGRDQTIANFTGLVADRDDTIARLSSQVEGRDGTIANFTNLTAGRDQTIADLTGQVAERDETIEALQQAASDSESDQVAALNAQVAERDDTINELSAQVAERDETINGLNGQVSETTGDLARLEAELATRDGSLTQTAAQIALLSAATEAGDAEVETLTAQITDLSAVVAERDATIAAMQTPVAAPEGFNADQCAERANAALEGAQINFDTNTATIQNGSIPLLERLTGIALACVGDGGLSVEVGGHTDSRGSDENNQALSEARAQAIVAFMAARGVPSEGLNAVGYGEAQPIGDNATETGRAANRRISFEWQTR